MTAAATIAEGLTEAQRRDMAGATCSVPRGHSDWVSDCICSTREFDALSKAGLAYHRERYSHGIILTPLGLEVRALLAGGDQ